MCGDTNEDFPEWAAISSDCLEASPGCGKVKDGDGGLVWGGHGGPLCLHKAELSQAPGTLRTTAGRECFWRCKLVLLSSKWAFYPTWPNATGRQQLCHNPGTMENCSAAAPPLAGRWIILSEQFICFNTINWSVFLFDGLEGTGEGNTLYTIKLSWKHILLFILGLFPSQSSC